MAKYDFTTDPFYICKVSLHAQNVGRSSLCMMIHRLMVCSRDMHKRGIISRATNRSIHRAIVALLSPVGLEVHALPYLLVVVSKPELTQRDTLVSVVEVDPFTDLESGA